MSRFLFLDSVVIEMLHVWQRDGGVLRVYPSQLTDNSVDVQPMLDRIVFFWSDGRTPHEVQPAYRDRWLVAPSVYLQPASRTHRTMSDIGRQFIIKHVHVAEEDFYSAKAELCDHCCLSVCLFVRLAVCLCLSVCLTYKRVNGCRPNMVVSHRQGSG